MRDGVGSGVPGLPLWPSGSSWPSEPPWPPLAPGSGPEGCTERDGVPGDADGVRVAAEDGSPAFLPPAGRASASRTVRRGPSPRPSGVTPGPGSASLPSCCVALPDGFGRGASLTLRQPARDAASAETVMAATAARVSAPLPGGDGDEAARPRAGAGAGAAALGGFGDV
ncbi:hypothetical protein SSP35_03_00310 [Streptomyces sp. NBRC 110611]|nr:hypothetical protein SSP35_03_00310 [Streptomyces sp. NBRC 110611]